jgi:type II secretory pathway pseudopilin PulG
MQRVIKGVKAFSLVELMVAIATLALLATLTVISFAETRKSSRDSRRKADIQIISSGITQYGITRGSTFITMPDSSCTLPNQNNPATVGVGSGCTGASGRSYGKMNLKLANTDGYSPAHQGRTYAQNTISEALLASGYLQSIPLDPLHNASALNDPNQRDYVVIRACMATGLQEVGTRGQLFAVWASLENNPTLEEVAIAARLPGGKNAGPGSVGGNVYIYDFATQAFEWLDGRYYNYGYALGNGVTKTVAYGGAACEHVRNT